MKTMKVLAAILVSFGLAAGAVMASVEDQIRARIAPVGEVCLQGEDCGTAAPASASASAGPRSGSEIYAASCQACHALGVAGAPILGDAASWGERPAQGMDILIEHAINGLGAMPPRGTCVSCSDEEIEAAVEYMIGEL